MKAISSLPAFILICLLTTTARAVSFPNASVTDTVCVQADFTLTDAQANLLREAGVTTVRAGFDGSCLVAATTGQFGWDISGANYAMDQFVITCAKAGLRVYATLGGPDPHDWPIANMGLGWDTGGTATSLGGYTGTTAGYLATAEFRQTFDDMAYQSVMHFTQLANSLYNNHTDLYGNSVDVASSWNPNFTWELWNEPNGGFWPGTDANDYMDLAMGVASDGTYNNLDCTKGVLQLIRDAATSAGGTGLNATIIAPGVASCVGSVDPTAYLTTCIQRGLLTKIDGLGVHPYRDINPETVLSDPSGLNYVALRNLMSTAGDDVSDAIGQNLPILASEWGYMSAASPSVGAQGQADYLQRMYLTNFTQSGQDHLVMTDWFMLYDAPNNAYVDQNNQWVISPWYWGILDVNNNPKPSYYAMQAMTSNLKDCTFWDKWDDGNPDHWILRFANSVTGREKMALWTTGTAGVVALPNGLGTTYLNGTPLYLGNVQQLQSGGTWSTATWSNSTGGVDGVWIGENQASFDANTAIDVNTPVTISGLQFAVGPNFWDTSSSTLTNTTGNGQLRIGLGGAAIHVAKSTWGSATATIDAPLVNENEAIPCNPAACQVRKTGGGTLVLNARNTFTGNLIIAEGKVKANVADALYGPVVTLLSSATNGGLQFVSGMTEFHLGGLAGDKNLDCGSHILDIGESGVSNDADGLGYSGVLSGTGAIRKYGAGTMLFSNANTFSGTIDVYDGLLAVSHSSALSGGSSAIALHGGGIDIRGCTLSRALTMDTAPITLANSALNTTSTLASNLDVKADITVATTGTLNVSGRLGSATTDMHTATKTGDGTLVLSGSDDNAYLDLAVNGGTVQLNKASAGSVHAATNVTVAGGATAQYQGSGDYQVYQGGIIALNGGTVDFNGQSQTGTAMAITAAGSTIANTSANYSVYTPSSIAVSPISGFSVNVSNPNSILAIEAPIVCNTAGGSVWPALYKTGPGALILGGSGDNTDLTLIVQEGVVALNRTSSPTVHTAAAADIGSGAKLEYATTGGDYQLRSDPGYWVHLSGGTLDFNGANQIGTDFAVYSVGSTLANTRANTTSIYTPNSFSYEQNFTVNTVGDLEINGKIVGNSVSWPALTKTGAGTLKLSGTADNTYTTLIASEGTVKLNKLNTTWGRSAATAVAVNAGATVQYTGTGNYQVAPGNWIQLNGGTLDLHGRTQADIDFYSQAAGSTLANTHSAAATLSPTSFTLNADLNVDTLGGMTISGPISGIGGLTKNGVGTLTLTSANTYSGGTTINNGALRIAAGGSLNASANGIMVGSGGKLLVNSTAPLTRSITINGGTLGGTGRYQGNLVVGNGRLSPGDGGIGTMRQEGNLTLDAGVVLDFDLGSTAGASDQWAFGGSGSLVLDGTLNILPTGPVTAGNYILFSGATSITDNGLDFGVIPASHEWSYAIQQHSGYYEVVVMAAPEPDTIVILATALLSLATYNWKRGRRNGK